MIKKIKKAFSMVELIFVIVVLGIVASISADTIAQIFKNTIPQKATNIATIKSEIAAEQIAKRLGYAVPWSVVAKNSAGADPIKLVDLPAGDTTHTIVEWIGVDGDSFEATQTPGWSGYCDVVRSTRTNCPTPGSALGNTDTLIKNFGGVGITDAITLFKTTNCEGINIYGPDTIGLVGPGTQCAFSLAGTGGGASLTFANTPKIRADMYSIAWSAYAIVPVNERDINGDGTNDVFDLALRYNYQPWQGESFANANGQILANNVSVFRISQMDNSIRFKICIKQPVGGGSSGFISMCKEKAVIR